MNRSIVATAALAALVLSLPASAQFQKPEDAVKYRQSSMFVMANHFGRIVQSTFVMRNPPHDAGLLGRIIGTKPAVALLGVKL